MEGPNSPEVLVHQIVERVAEKNPGKAALLWLSENAQEGHVISYSELNRYSNILSSLLGEVLGQIRACWAWQEAVQHNVAVLVDEGPEIVMSEFAVLKSGSAFVPIDPTWPDARIAYILRDSSAMVALVPRASCRVLQGKLTAEGMQLFVVSASSEHVEGCAGRSRDGSRRMLVMIVVEDVLQSSVGGFSEGLAEFLKASSESCRDPEQVNSFAPESKEGYKKSHIIYTSGTTGEPKGVVCEHR
eukprot:746178-Hanusia_phi.AAC.2